MEPDKHLQNFLKPYDKEIQQLTLELREFVLQRTPNVNELLYDAFNAVVLAYSLSEKLGDAFCHLAVYTNHVNFGFNRGAELESGKSTLEGSGKLIRHIKVQNMQSLQKDLLGNILFEAVSNAKKRNPKLNLTKIHPKSFVVSVADNKRRPEKKISGD